MLAQADAVEIAAIVFSIDREVKTGFDLAWGCAGQFIATGGQNSPVIDLADGCGPFKSFAELLSKASAAKPGGNGVDEEESAHLGFYFRASFLAVQSL